LKKFFYFSGGRKGGLGGVIRRGAPFGFPGFCGLFWGNFFSQFSSQQPFGFFVFFWPGDFGFFFFFPIFSGNFKAKRAPALFGKGGGPRGKNPGLGKNGGGGPGFFPPGRGPAGGGGGKPFFFLMALGGPFWPPKVFSRRGGGGGGGFLLKKVGGGPPPGGFIFPNSVLKLPQFFGFFLGPFRALFFGGYFFFFFTPPTGGGQKGEWVGKKKIWGFGGGGEKL